MNHPTQEQWSELLYDEAPTPVRQELERHLKVCPGCREKWKALRVTMSQLNAWDLPPQTEPRLVPDRSPFLKWAAAAALVVSTAFATGRLSKPALNTAELTAQIKPLEERIGREIQTRIEAEVSQATEKALLAAKLKLQAELAGQLQMIAEKAEANAADEKEQFAVALAALRDQDKALYAAMQELDRKRETDFRGLRQDLEKVALFTDQNLRSAQRQLVQLASSTEKSSQ